MKSKIVGLFLFLNALVAQAGNEGPQASPPLPSSPVIAQMYISYGLFAAPQSPIALSVDVLKDGQALASEIYLDAPDKVRFLAQLSQEVLANLQVLVSESQPGDLIDPSPENPGCMDAPFVNYFAVLDDGTKITVSRKADCKDYIKSNETAGDRKVREVLDALSKLVYLR